jgi:hypothetical protein
MQRAYRRTRSSVDAANIAVTHADAGRWDLAARWWDRAVAVGTNRGDGVSVAMGLLLGKGRRRDPLRARQLLVRAARGTSPTEICEWDREWAMALLGVVAASGIGGARDLRAARKWLARANSDHDYPEARAALAALGTRALDPLEVARGNPWARLMTR